MYAEVNIHVGGSLVDKHIIQIRAGERDTPSYYTTPIEAQGMKLNGFTIAFDAERRGPLFFVGQRVLIKGNQTYGRIVATDLKGDRPFGVAYGAIGLDGGKELLLRCKPEDLEAV